LAVVIDGKVFTDDDLLRLSAANPEYRVERNDDGALVLSPTNWKSGAMEAEAAHQLSKYRERAGGAVFSSSAGFTMPGSGVKAPDASWISPERLASVPAAEKAKAFPSIVPDVVIEIASPSDDWNTVVAKVKRFHQDGARFCVAIDPATKTVIQFGTAPEGLALDYQGIMSAAPL